MIQSLYHYVFLIYRGLFSGNDSVCVNRLIFGLLGSELWLDFAVVNVIFRLEVQAWAAWKDHGSLILIMWWSGTYWEATVLNLLELWLHIWRFKALFLENFKQLIMVRIDRLKLIVYNLTLILFLLLNFLYFNFIFILLFLLLLSLHVYRWRRLASDVI